MDKILVTFLFPTIEVSFDVYIPINKKIGTIKKYVLSSIDDLISSTLNKNVRFLDRNTGVEYDNNILVKDSTINNGTKIVVM